MKAMILAAGRGERLRPLTDSIPKPLIKAGGLELIVWHINKLKAAGISDIVVNSAYLSDKIVSSLQDGHAFGVNIQHSVEEEGGLETAGGIVRALPYLGDEPFFVINGDIFLDIDYKALIEAYVEPNLNGLLYLTKNPEHNLKGDFALSGDRICYGSDYTFTGAAIYTKKAFDGVPDGRLKLRVLFDRWIESQTLKGSVLECPWFDVGTVQRLEILDSYLKEKL